MGPTHILSLQEASALRWSWGREPRAKWGHRTPGIPDLAIQPPHAWWPVPARFRRTARTHRFKDLGSLKSPKGWLSAVPTCFPPRPPAPLQTAHSWQQQKSLNSSSERGQEVAVRENQASQSRWLYAKQASAVKTLRAINSNCWVKFFPCPIHYWTVNFVFVPVRHSSSQMTALSIKEHAVTGIQRELCQPCLPGGETASPPRNPGTLQHLNQYARVNYRGSEGLSRRWWWGSRANGLDQYAVESHTWIHTSPPPPAPGSHTGRPTTPSPSIISNLPIICFTGLALIRFLDGCIGNGESRGEGNNQSQIWSLDTQAGLLGLTIQGREFFHRHIQGDN